MILKKYPELEKVSRQHINSLIIDNSLSLSPHALPKGDKAVVYQSKDVLGVLDKYIKNVVRFNYVSILIKRKPRPKNRKSYYDHHGQN